MELVARGHIKVFKRFANGERQLVEDKSNQLTYAYLSRILELLAQRTTDPDPEQNQIYSIWFEANAAGVAGLSPSDVQPDASSTIVMQKTFTDAQKLSLVSGEKRILEYRSTLESDEGNGFTIAAVNMFSKGDGTLPEPPNPIGWVGGTNNVHLYARQLIGPYPKTDQFALDINWGFSLEIAS